MREEYSNKRRRWYDKDPILSRSMKTLEASDDETQIKVALNLIKIIVEHNLAFSEYTDVNEIIEAVPIYVIKKSGTLEIFDPNKIIAGVRRACYKRPVTDEQIQAIVNEIENELANKLTENITSEEIGNMVMEKFI